MSWGLILQIKHRALHNGWENTQQSCTDTSQYVWAKSASPEGGHLDSDQLLTNCIHGYQNRHWQRWCWPLNWAGICPPRAHPRPSELTLSAGRTHEGLSCWCVLSSSWVSWAQPWNTTPLSFQTEKSFPRANLWRMDPPSLSPARKQLTGWRRPIYRFTVLDSPIYCSARRNA